MGRGEKACLEKNSIVKRYTSYTITFIQESVPVLLAALVGAVNPAGCAIADRAGRLSRRCFELDGDAIGSDASSAQGEFRIGWYQKMFKHG